MEKPVYPNQFYIGFQKTTINTIIERQEYRKILLSLDTTKDISLEQRQEINAYLNSQSTLSIEAYCELFPCLNLVYSTYPDISEERILFLAKTGALSLNENVFSDAESDEIRYSLLKENFEKFIENKETYHVEQQILKLLIQSDLHDDNKKLLISDVEPASLETDKEFVSRVLSLVNSDDYLKEKIDLEVLSVLIHRSKNIPERISLLCSTFDKWDEGSVMNYLVGFGYPYNEILNKSRRVKLEHTDLNQRLTDLLKFHGYISSNPSSLGIIRIYHFRS